MSSMARRFVHLIVNDLTDIFTLRNIDVELLFTGAASTSKRLRAAQPPRPAAFFESRDPYDHTEFFLLGTKIVSVNRHRHTILYDTSNSAVRAGPEMRHGKFIQPAWAAVRGKLYLANTYNVRERSTSSCEVLRFDGERKDWSWDPFLPPPFIDDGPSCNGDTITSYAAGDDRHIWISALNNGTYTFDTRTGEWRKEGGWLLPFRGRAQYVPEFGLYFGFSAKFSKMCSADLFVGMESLEAPACRNVWDDVDGHPDEGWRLAGSFLTYLGCGKLCVTRFYDTCPDPDAVAHNCDAAVLTAVEAIRDSCTGEVLQMIRGASKCYKFDVNTVYGWAL